MIRRSRLETTSGRSVDASLSASKQMAGRRLANSSKSLRSRKRPRSGFLSKGLLSHLGPPTAPNSTASAACASLIVSSVTGTPSASNAAPPTSARSMAKERPRFFASQWMTRSVSAITSGPMPSPGRSRILYVMSSVRVFFPLKRKKEEWPKGPGERVGLHPRLAEFAARLEIGNLVLVAQRQADIVPAVQQTLLAEGIDIEFDAATVRAANFLLFEIDTDDGVGAAFRVIHQPIHVGLRQRNRQNAVLEAIVVEDIGKRGCDHTANAEIEKRPWRVLA